MWSATLGLNQGEASANNSEAATNSSDGSPEAMQGVTITSGASSSSQVCRDVRGRGSKIGQKSAQFGWVGGMSRAGRDRGILLNATWVVGFIHDTEGSCIWLVWWIGSIPYSETILVGIWLVG
jgi:hypothetical protein